MRSVRRLHIEVAISRMDLKEAEMRESLDAVFENGTFKPLKPVSLPLHQGQQVKITVEASIEPEEDLLVLASQVYEGLTDQQVDEIEQIALDRSDFFKESVTQ